MPKLRIFYTSDLHGSERCYKKFINAARIYKANVLVVGGDLTGKRIVPIIRQADKTYKMRFLGEDVLLKNENDLEKAKKQIKAIGYYVHIGDESEMRILREDEKKLQETFAKSMKETIANWVKFAEEKLKGSNVKLYMMPGNDDDYSIDPLLEGHDIIVNPNEKVVTVNDHEMLSLGYANITPWQCPRDITEEELGSKIEALVSKISRMDRAVFNTHVPPYKTTIDLAPELDEKFRPKAAGGGGVVMGNVGSTAVRRAIETHQPLLGLHGHIHDSKGMCRIGRTLCLNPGSEYVDGILRGAIIDIDGGQVRDYLFTSG
jgi:Icc-related predicted phosphoesterase